ncbi:MAG: hypothetical protein IPQ17_12070 [Xanthomonadales bacterium]|nr:hypothetical protein [Xanthomonadales bacterium]
MTTQTQESAQQGQHSECRPTQADQLRWPLGADGSEPGSGSIVFLVAVEKHDSVSRTLFARNLEFCRKRVRVGLKAAHLERAAMGLPGLQRRQGKTVASTREARRCEISLAAT